MIKLSIIVPIYNVENYLRRCLDSLVNQTLEEIEILLINDGSTDSSQDIVDEYVARYPKIIKSFIKENGGQGSARNLGISIASGEYLGFVDSDDFIELSMYKNMYDLAKREDADVITCDYSYISIAKGKKNIHLFKASSPKELFFNPWAAPWNKIYRTSLIKDNQIRFPEKLVYEDTAFYLNMIPYIKKINHLDDCFVNQVQRESSSMNGQNEKKVMQIISVMNYSLEFYEQRNFYQKYKEELEYFYVKILFSSSILRICQIRNRKQRSRCLNAMIEEVNRKFPEYKKNKYIHSGIRGLYLRSINKASLPIYANIFYFIRYFGRSNL